VRHAVRHGIAEQVVDSSAKLRRILWVENSRDRCRPNT